MSTTNLQLTSEENEELARFAEHVNHCAKCTRPGGGGAALRLCTHGTWLAVKAANIIGKKAGDESPTARQETLTW